MTYLVPWNSRGVRMALVCSSRKLFEGTTALGCSHWCGPERNIPLEEYEYESPHHRGKKGGGGGARGARGLFHMPLLKGRSLQGRSLGGWMTDLIPSALQDGGSSPVQHGLRIVDRNGVCVKGYLHRVQLVGGPRHLSFDLRGKEMEHEPRGCHGPCCGGAWIRTGGDRGGFAPGVLT